MVYRRKRYGGAKRSTYRRTNYGKRNTMYARRKYVKKRYVKKKWIEYKETKLVQQKYWLTSGSAAAVNVVQPGSADPGSTDFGVRCIDLTGLACGAEAHQRIGNKVTWKSINLILSLENAGDKDQDVRCMLVLDKQPNGALFTLDQIIRWQVDKNTSIAMRNNDWIKRFSVFKDYKTTLSNVSKDGNKKIIKLFKKLTFSSLYTANTGTFASIGTNALYLVLIGSVKTNISNQPGSLVTASATLEGSVKFVDP